MSAGTADGVRVDCGGVPVFWVEAPAPYRAALQEELVRWRRYRRLYGVLRYLQAPPVF